MKPIRATNFYQYSKCPRRVYLHFFGDSSKKIPYSEFIKEKMGEGLEYEKKVIEKFKFKQPEQDVSLEEAFEQTLELMKKGEKLIYQGVLIQDNLIGIPDFLEKIKGKSDLGDFYYQPMDIKMGLNAKEEYVMQICFYCYMLKQIQGVYPHELKILLGDGSIRTIETQKYIEKFGEMFSKIKQITKDKEEECVHICGNCKECSWKDFCLEVAEKLNDLSLIFNIGREHVDKLKDYDIHNLKDAVNLNVKKLSEIKGLEESSLERWKLQAKSLLDKKPIKIKDYKFPDGESIYLDFEDTQDKREKTVYLFGMVINGKYKYFLAERPSEEKKTWMEFLEFFKKKENFKIYVYSGHEKAMLKKLYERYEGDKATYDKIMENLIDLLAVVKKTMIFPVYSYGIKDIAKSLGFHWTSNKAGGGQSMIWYDDWLKTGDKKHLKEILEYNKEDCEAEVIIRDFIEKN